MYRLLASSLFFATFLNAQDAAKGVIAGQVLDATTGQVIRQAKISVEGREEATVTDLEGKFKLDLPVGRYKLRFAAQNYNDTTVDEIDVLAGGVTEASTVMSSKSAVTTVEVVEKVGAVAASAEAALTERRLAAAVSDSMSSEEIRKSTASDAAGALQKVTGVSIVENGYVYVRGLGERYSATMLNAAMIPTTEPEKRVVPLDLFPAALIDNIKVLKSYTPDLPGEFSGGLVQMQTMDFPTLPTLRVGVSYGFNSRTTFRRFDTYRGGSRDFLGFDDGTRDLPRIIPQDGRLFTGSYTDAEFQQFGRAFSNNWVARPIESMRPAQTYNVVGGNTFGKVGIVGALTFTNRPQFQKEIQRYYIPSNNQAVLFTDYPDFEGNNEGVRMGGVFNLAYRLSPTNKIVFRNTLTRDTDKEARTFQGYQGGIDSVIRAERLRFIERNLFSTGVEGEHLISRWSNSLFRWQFTYSNSKRDEPDLREVIRGQQPDGRFSFLALGSSGLRFFNNLEDRIYEPQGEWSLPFFRGGIVGQFKVGFRGTFRSRDFVSRRFNFIPINPRTLNLFAPSEELFAPANIRPDGFVIRERTRGTDTYSADMDIYGGYSMVDLALGPRWRIVAGLRFEDADINVVTIDPQVPGAVPAVANLANRDALPGVNVIYQLTTRQNIRVGYGRTVSRPDFRELSPFDFTNVLGGYNVAGNPNLVRARIDNFDARWEWFPGGDQIVAASYFYKHFDNPIEVTVQPTIDLRQSFLNADSANNQGFELEFRRNLGSLSQRFSPYLAPFAFQANFTFVDSQIRIPDNEQSLVLTTRNRPLMGQSRYIYNLIVEWVRPQWRSNARFYVNSQSRRLTEVGTFGLPDVYQERNTFFDFVYQYDIKESGKWTLRFAAENLGDNRYFWTQAGLLQRRFQLGRTFSIGTSYSFF